MRCDDCHRQIDPEKDAHIVITETYDSTEKPRDGNTLTVCSWLCAVSAADDMADFERNDAEGAAI